MNAEFSIVFPSPTMSRAPSYMAAPLVCGACVLTIPTRTSPVNANTQPIQRGDNFFSHSECLQNMGQDTAAK